METFFFMAAAVFTFIAAAIHLYICCLELPLFGSPKFQKTFKTKPEHHDLLRAPFNNLGVYNGAIGTLTLVGLCLMLLATPTEGGSHAGFLLGLGLGMTTFGLCVMLIAGNYLFLTAPDKRRAALVQALPPLLALCAWVAWL